MKLLSGFRFSLVGVRFHSRTRRSSPLTPDVRYLAPQVQPVAPCTRRSSPTHKYIRRADDSLQFVKTHRSVGLARDGRCANRGRTYTGGQEEGVDKYQREPLYEPKVSNKFLFNWRPKRFQTKIVLYTNLCVHTTNWYTAQCLGQLVGGLQLGKRNIVDFRSLGWIFSGGFSGIFLEISKKKPSHLPAAAAALVTVCLDSTRQFFRVAIQGRGPF